MPHLTRQHVAAAARQAFKREFGAAPEVLAWAPGRINLIGEHTDYNGGLSLPMAIDLGCVAAARRGTTARDRIIALDLDERTGFDNSPPPQWSRYVTGVLELMRQRIDAPGVVDILVTSSVPIGAGLSSSAALEVAVATAFEALAGSAIDPLDKARLCQKAEHDYAGTPCGLMDQLVSVFAEEGHAMLIDFRDDSFAHVPAPDKVLVADSGVRHDLAAGEYAARRAACARACEIFGVDALGELEAPAWEDSRLDHELTRCVRHVVGEIERTRLAATALKLGRLADLGALMFESHRSLRDDYRVSCEEIDAIVDAAVGVEGVHGARMTGGGFGGSVIAIADPQAFDRLLNNPLAAERARVIVRAGAGAVPL